jgi:hypothetical protein
MYNFSLHKETLKGFVPIAILAAIYLGVCEVTSALYGQINYNFAVWSVTILAVIIRMIGVKTYRHLLNQEKEIYMAMMLLLISYALASIFCSFWSVSIYVVTAVMVVVISFILIFLDDNGYSPISYTPSAVSAVFAFIYAVTNLLNGVSSPMLCLAVLLLSVIWIFIVWYRLWYSIFIKRLWYNKGLSIQLPILISLSALLLLQW